MYGLNSETVQISLPTDVITYVEVGGFTEIALERLQFSQRGEPTATTDINGNYAITNLRSGSYTVREVLEEGWLPTTPSPDEVTLTVGQIATGIDFGNYEVGLDFGDAPDPYPTTLAENGGRHPATGPTLGANRDWESDGQPDPNALGDDNTGAPDDEDGVVFTSALVEGQAATVDVTTPANGLLNAWIDFNGDGDWADTGELIFTNEPLTAGVNSLSFTVPESAVPTDRTFARFRLSSEGNLSFDGLALDGKVEDYATAIEAEPLMNILVGFEDTLGQPITSVPLGGTFHIVISAQDLRTVGDDKGAFGAIADVLYDTSLIDVLNLAHTQPFDMFVGGTIDDNLGLIDNAGGLDGLQQPPDRSPQEVFVLETVATATGMLTVDTAVGVDPHGVINNLLFGIDEAVTDQVVFGSGMIEIGLPDLVATAFDVTPDHVLAGQTTATMTIANEGNAPAGAFLVDVVLSDDQTIAGHLPWSQVTSMFVRTLAKAVPTA